MRKARFLMSMVELILKIEISLLGISIMVLTKSGTSNMLMLPNLNQPRDRRMKILDFTSKDHSTSSQNWVNASILISFLENLSLRLQMEERPKSSGSIKNLRPLSLNNTRVGHLTSKMLEEPITCKCGTPTPDGSNSSDTRIETSSMLRTIRFLMLLVEKILKDKPLEFPIDIMVLTRDGESFILTQRAEIELRE